TGNGPGSEPRNPIRGPGYVNTDLSLFKNIDVHTNQSIQVRIEMFNLFNQVHFAQPNGTIGSATFGQITSAGDGRIVQLGIKYIF
ncbi:MAG: hypothetical protein ACRD1V_18690, partial [Vicinamibacterales bacterium]